MHIVQTVAKFLTVTAAASIGSAATVRSRSTQLVARDTPFADLDLSNDFWGTADTYCTNGFTSKRDLSHVQARVPSPPDGYDNVPPNNYVGYFNAVTKGLWTNFLVSCFGVVITGDTDNIVSKDKFLAHFYATSGGLDNLWGALKQEVQAQGLTNLRAWLSAPDTSEPGRLDPAVMQTVEDTMKGLLKDLTGQDPTVRHHRMSDASNYVGNWGTMQVNGMDKTVMIDGNLVEFGSPE
ncbi:hypothetical protein F5Y03DRAFT_388947 [Xylaria venustula]|nr:hypothetical protein F5Y03DRAFT_388947 [Xylaria venustula]